MLKFGADPEYFSVVQDGNKSYAVSPALLEKDCGLKPVIDDPKHPIYFDKKEFSWMMDGVAWELTIKNPQKSIFDLKEIIDNAKDFLANELHRFKWNGMEVFFSPYSTIPINSSWYIPFLEQEKIYQGFIFGCDEDNDAFDSEYVCTVQDVETYPYRHGGGHLHLSGIDELKNFPIPAIKLLAITLGNYCVSRSWQPENDKIRANNYGMPGKYRIQNYKNGDIGVEYRSPSNTWTGFSDMDGFDYWIYRAIEFLKARRGDIVLQYELETFKAISEFDQQLSQNILNNLEDF